MFVRAIEENAREQRGGQTSYLLLGKGDFGSKDLAITWVECGPSSQQPLHSHPGAEQAYVIVRGRGEMIVGEAGFGVRLQRDAGIFNTKGYFATLLVLVLLSSIASGLFQLAKRPLVRWQSVHLLRRM